MVKLIRKMVASEVRLTFNVLVLHSLLLLSLLSGHVEARQRGDDIIMTKGKLIMRGGKGKGNLILDTGKSSEHEGHHHPMPMMSLMGHYFDPHSFYPMQHHHQPQVMIKPIYIEDHSAMHHHQQHHEPEQHHEHHHEEHHYQHEHEQPHYEHHHEEPHYQHHEEPQYHHQEYHHEQPHEMKYEHHGHHEEQYHHEPVEHHGQMEHHEQPAEHYEHEPHHEHMMGHHGGYESHPMMSMMMMHDRSRLQPAYQQLAVMQQLQAMQEQQSMPVSGQPQALSPEQVMAMSQSSLDQKQQQPDNNKAATSSSAKPEQQKTSKVSSFLDQAGNNPLVAMIKPLFKRNPEEQKKKPK